MKFPLSKMRTAALAVLGVFALSSAAFAARESARALSAGEELRPDALTEADGYTLERVADVAFGKVYRFRSAEKYVVLSTDEEGNVLSVNTAPAAGLADGRNAFTEDSVQTDGLGREVVVPVTCKNGEYSLSDGLRNIAAFDMNEGTYLQWREAIVSGTGVFEDPVAVSAYSNIIKAYDFYADEANIGTSLLGPDGGNDRTAGNADQRGELSVWVLVHYGQNYQNANFSYDGNTHTVLLYIGDGTPNGDLYRQARAADVIAHEYQHAVTYFSAGLLDLNEPGAISEAVSDLFGALVEGHDPCEEAFWLTGENAVPAGRSALRSAAMPAGEYRLNAKEKYPPCFLDHTHLNCDYGGVHHNSTILTHMQYRLYCLLPEFFTRERIGTLWFTTLNTLTPNADFMQFARQFRTSAELLGYPADVLETIDRCLFASGLTEEEDFHFVTFRDPFGNVIDKVCVRDGDPALAPRAPVPESSAKYDYVFSGWNGDVSHVTRDLTVTALYTPVLRSYPVRFYDADGKFLKEETVPYGASASPPVPETPTDRRYDYIFQGWEGGDYTCITGETDLHAVFSAIECYFVTFLNDKDEVILSVRVRDGATVSPPPIPEKAATPYAEYCFLGWDAELRGVHEDMTVRPLFREEIRRYTLTFLLDGTVYRWLSVPYGTRAELPALPERENCTDWYFDEALSLPAAEFFVTEDVTLYARHRSGCASLSAFFPPLCALLLPPFFIRRKR